MNVSDMHIEVKQSLQQVAAHTTRKYNAGELDWILTKMQERLIQSSISPKSDGSGGFEVNSLYANRIRSLVVTGTELPAYIDDNKGRYKVILPADYAYLLDDSSKSILLCDSITPKTSTTSISLYTLRQNYSAKSEPPYYTTLTTNLGTQVTIPNALNFGHTYAGYNKIQDIQFLVPIIAKLGGYYWENFGDINKPRCYIKVVPADVAIVPTMVIDSLDATTTDKTTLSLISHIGQGKSVKNRLTPSNKISALLGTAFYKTAAYSPISEIANNTLYIYYDNSFIVTSATISYIRKCAPISLSLGSNSELPEDFHQQICDLAVEYIQGRLKDVQGVQLTENDINKRVML